MDDIAIRQVRSFNRTVAERIGTLGDSFLGRARPYGESRTLWEIAELGDHGIEVRALRLRLGLDSGYTSRVLRSLETQGLVTVTASPYDGRVRLVHLTEAGRAERAELDRRSDAVAASFLVPLSDRQCARLVAAMTEVERLLRASLVTFAVEDPTTPDARWCIGQYLAELNVRFDAGFDPALSGPADAHDLTPPNGALIVARMRERAVGCVGLKRHGDDPAEVKRMWVSPEARGVGLGGRLLQEVERYARGIGIGTLRLETNGALTEAIALYRSRGYREIERFTDDPYAQHWFEKHLP
jgi:DNA-binding MarR family transcriptional regulator/RimJ/RimL family protein N-acetyltransferase